MKKIWSRCFAEKAVPSKKSNLPDANVETNSKDVHLDDLKYQMSINDLPTEILFLIFEKLDKASVFYCFFVCKRWRSIVFSIAHTEKSNMMWCFLYKQYLMEGYYQQNSNSNCLMPFQELIESSLNWNYKCSTSLSKSIPVINAVQMTIYRDNLIVVTSQCVKYYNKKTFKIKKTICVDKCYDFIENDYMVARTIKYDNGEGYKLQLFGKSSFDDYEWESQITREVTQTNKTQELDVRLFKIEDNHCFVVRKSNNTLYSYHWMYPETPTAWHIRFRCRYFGDMGDIIAMHLGFKQVYLLKSSGALLCYHRRRGDVMAKVYTFSKVIKSDFVQLVHRNNLLLSVPDDRPSRIMRIRESGFPVLFRYQTRRLTCVTEHGIVLFLGFSDGKVKIMKPMDLSRENVTKHFINLSDFKKGPPAPVVSIAVDVDKGKQSIYVATTSFVYRFTANFPDETNLWDKENLVGLLRAPTVEQLGI